MYKKQFAEAGHNLLSKKDLKGLKTQLLEEYPGLDDKKVDELLPEGQVKAVKLDNRCILYQVGDAPPSFFDAEGRGEVYPCLPTLWQHPHILPELTIHAPVSKFVLNGADLMLPGLVVPANGIAGFGTVAKGQKRCIKIEGNPYPIAVGKMLVNQAQMEKLKGKGMEVLHVFKDCLWAHSGKLIPNAGFTEKEDEVTPCDDATWTLGGAAAGGAEASPAAAKAASSSSATAAGDESPKASGAASLPADSGAAGGGGGGGGRAAGDWTQDDLLEFCFLQAFRVSLVEDRALPVEASELYEKHMKPQRPEGTALDVKKSSHKQIGKFLNVMRKAKLIDVTEKKGVISVSKVDRKHKKWAELEEKFAGDAGAASAAAASAEAAPAAAGMAPPTVSTLWKPTHYTEPLFKVAGKGKSDLYTWEQAVGILKAYCEGASLVDGEDVKLSEGLLAILYRASGPQKKELTFPETAAFDELEEKLQERMHEHTVIDVAGVGPTTRKGPQVKIDVSLSRKGAHNVTRVGNLEAYGLDVLSIGDELKKKLSCTVTLEDMPGKNSKDKLMQLQGHMTDELAEYLQSRYGITKAFMSVK